MQTDTGAAVVFSSLMAGDRTIEATDSPLFFNKEKGVAVVPLSQHLVARLVAPLSFHSTNTMRNRRRQRLERLEREWDFLYNVRHRGIVRVYERVETSSGWIGFTQEKLEIDPHEDAVRPYIRTVGEWLGFGQAVAHALEAAHRHGIVNCDLKPSNIGIRVRANGSREPVIHDWDRLQRIGDFSSDTQDEDSKSIALTPWFASPEQVDRKRIYPPSDVFSLAVTLLSLATGKPGFGGQCIVVTFDLILTGAYQHWLTFKDSVQFRMAHRVLERAIDRNPNKRYQSAKDFARALLAVERSLTQDQLNLVLRPHRQAST